MLSCKLKVNKNIFLSEDTGFGVFRVTPKESSLDFRIIVGTLYELQEGDHIEAEGNITVHPRFGEQLSVVSFKKILPDDNEGIIRYLAQSRIKGLGRKTAEKIVNTFGTETFRILEEEPEKLDSLKGVKKSIVKEIKKNFKENRELREIRVRLSPFGIGLQTILKVHREFGADTADILETDPYTLINRVKGIGFKTADTIASGYNIPKDLPGRISAALNYIIDTSEQKNGDMYIEEEELYDRSSELLRIERHKIIHELNKAVDSGNILRESDQESLVLSKKNFFTEKEIASVLKTKVLKEHEECDKFEKKIREVCKNASYEFSEEQITAMEAAAKSAVTIITGGPGTGKTTVIKALIEIFHPDLRIKICAPTGRAAKRIEEATGFRASTVHRLLKINPETGKFQHDNSSPLPADIVIIDEASMVDSYLFLALLKSLKQETRFIIIGDKDQLPSVGPGNVLRDIIKSDLFPTVVLKRNFRQKECNLIIDNAFRINRGESLILKPYSEDLDFVFIRVNSQEQALKKTQGIVSYHKDQYNFNSQDFQILCPMYRGVSGIDSVNRTLQKEFNPSEPFIRKENSEYRILDKVMQLKNNYEKEVFNGDQGVIADFSVKDKKIIIDFDSKMVEYSVDELDEINLSYAVSVHKSQGSEYDIVVMILLPSHSIMLNREIFYTGVTRAKKKLFLISDEYTLNRAIQNSTPNRRKTLLGKRLNEPLNGPLFAEE